MTHSILAYGTLFLISVVLQAIFTSHFRYDTVRGFAQNVAFGLAWVVVISFMTMDAIVVPVTFAGCIFAGWATQNTLDALVSYKARYPQDAPRGWIGE